METKVLVSYCKQNCKSFEDIVRHLTDTHVCNTYYSARHFAQKAKLSMATLTDDGNSDDDIQQTMLKTIRECSRLRRSTKSHPRHGNSYVEKFSGFHPGVKGVILRLHTGHKHSSAGACKRSQFAEVCNKKKGRQ